MTGHTNGLIAVLERLLQRRLRWVIILLHCVELSLCHVFTGLDDSTTNPDSFDGPIKKKVAEPVSIWEIREIKSIANQHFSIITQ